MTKCDGSTLSKQTERNSALDISFNLEWPYTINMIKKVLFESYCLFLFIVNTIYLYVQLKVTYER